MESVTIATILLGCLLLAYANGANDNFKGVATLFGSGTADYRRALTWATLTTLLGSLLAFLVAQDLLMQFGGGGIVPDELIGRPEYLAAVAVAAGLTVLVATRLGMPISTTHALVGALVGAGLASGTSVEWWSLGKNFFAPLIFSPLAAIAGTAVVYPVFRWIRVTLGISKETCFCVGSKRVAFVPQLSPVVALERAQQLSVSLGSAVSCQERYAGRLLGINCARALDGLHFLSAGLVSFARGLNDTPKIAALLLAVPSLGPLSAVALCGAIIAVGGITSARRVAVTMSHRITPMNAGQGFSANLITGLLVVLASRWGFPVSTTHVSCGSLFGLGAVTGRARWRMIAKLLLVWITTLPTAALFGWLVSRTLGMLS